MSKRRSETPQKLNQGHQRGPVPATQLCRQKPPRGRLAIARNFPTSEPIPTRFGVSPLPDAPHDGRKERENLAYEKPLTAATVGPPTRMGNRARGDATGPSADVRGRPPDHPTGSGTRRRVRLTIRSRSGARRRLLPTRAQIVRLGTVGACVVAAAGTWPAVTEAKTTRQLERRIDRLERQVAGLKRLYLLLREEPSIYLSQSPLISVSGDFMRGTATCGAGLTIGGGVFYRGTITAGDQIIESYRDGYDEAWHATVYSPLESAVYVQALCLEF